MTKWEQFELQSSKKWKMHDHKHSTCVQLSWDPIEYEFLSVLCITCWCLPLFGSAQNKRSWLKSIITLLRADIVIFYQCIYSPKLDKESYLCVFAEHVIHLWYTLWLWINMRLISFSDCILTKIHFTLKTYTLGYLSTVWKCCLCCNLPRRLFSLHRICIALSKSLSGWH